MACDKVYGVVEPFPQFTTLVKYILGGPDPLDFCNAYLSRDGTHWHYITMGFTNLRAKQHVPNRPGGWNGYGFELTLRLERLPGEKTAPIWPFVMFQAIAKYVFGTGNVFEPNETCPMEDYFRSKEIDTTLGGFMLMEDPEIEGYETERGRVRFIQMVGVTLEECKDAIRWNTEGFLKLVLEHYPLGVTYLHRGSICDDEEVKSKIRDGIAQDGSSLGVITCQRPAFVKVNPDGDIFLQLSLVAVESLVDALPYRIPYGRFLVLEDTEPGPFDGELVPSSLHCVSISEGAPTITVEKNEASGKTMTKLSITTELTHRIVDTLRPLTLGRLSWPELPQLEVEVIPSFGDRSSQ